MDKSEVRITQVDSEDRVLKGVQDRGLVQFNCLGCNKPLMCIQLVSNHKKNDANISTTVVVECGYCGGYSDVKSIVGSFAPGAVEDNMCIDVIEHNVDGPVADVSFKAWEK